jgi:hypothetical protein
MKTLASTVLFVTVLAAAPTHAQPTWLSPEIQERAAEDLAARISNVDTEGQINPNVILPGAQKAVATFVARLDGLGEAGVLELKPVFTELELPQAGQPHLDAIAAFGACNLFLESVYGNAQPREGILDERVTAATMSVGIALTSAYLRHHYLSAGGNDEDFDAFLASEAMNAVSYDIQTSLDLLQHVMARCSPSLGELIAE